MFDFLGKAARVVADVATLPVSAAADVVTFGGLANDRDESYTGAKAKRILTDVTDALDKIAS